MGVSQVDLFGSFIYFSKFCADRFGDRKMVDDSCLLQSVKCRGLVTRLCCEGYIWIIEK